MIERDAVILTGGVIIGAIIAWQISAPPDSSSTQKEQRVSVEAPWGAWDHLGFTSLDRFHDAELRVTCWKYGPQGVSCLPDGQIGRAK